LTNYDRGGEGERGKKKERKLPLVLNLRGGRGKGKKYYSGIVGRT